MKVECQKCGAEYSLDDALVSSSGTSVRCSKCNEVFKVFPKDISPDLRDKWRVRQASGTIISFERLGALQQWISKKKIQKDDMLSLNNGPWKRIGDMPQMASFFPKTSTLPPPAVSSGFPRGKLPAEKPKVSSAQAEITDKWDSTRPPDDTKKDLQSMGSNAPMALTLLSQSKQEVKTTYSFQPDSTAPDKTRDKPTKPIKAPKISSPPDDTIKTSTPSQLGIAKTEPHLVSALKNKPEIKEFALPTEREPDLSQIPASGSRESWNQGAQIKVEGPAWTEKDSPLRRYDDDLDELPVKPRKKGPWIVIGLIVTLIAAAVYIFQFERDRFSKALDHLLASPAEDRYTKFYDHGMESFLLDSDTQFRQADREFQKVLALEENHAPTLAALAQMYAVWAQYIRDDFIDALTDASSQSNKHSGDMRETQRLEREFQEKLSEAQRWARQAISVAKDSVTANLAMADIARLQGNLNSARQHLEKARSKQNDADTEYTAVLLEQELGTPLTNLINKLGKLLEEKPLIRAMYRKSRYEASTQDVVSARNTLEKLFELNSDHLRARDLAARIDDKKLVVLTVPMVDSKSAPEPVENGEPTTDRAADTATSGIDTDSGQKEQIKKTQDTALSPLTESSKNLKDKDSIIEQAAKLQEKGRTNEALKLFNQVLEQSPNDPEALTGVGYCYLDKGSTGNAIASFRRALGANSSFTPAILGLAETYKSLKQKEQAIKYYNEYLKIKPKGAESDLARRNLTLLEDAVSFSDIESESKEEKSSSLGEETKREPEGDKTDTPKVDLKNQDTEGKE